MPNGPCPRAKADGEGPDRSALSGGDLRQARTGDAADATVAPLVRSGAEVYAGEPGDLRKQCQKTGFTAIAPGR
ncbi:MAG TPA: hypothetical protein VIZ43_14935 [Trebonia sp.]